MIDELAGKNELTACTRDICRCTLMGPSRGEVYCSEACRSADESGIESENCACGHPPCDER